MINDYYFLICTSFSLPKTVGAKSVVRREHTCNTRLFLFIFRIFFLGKRGRRTPIRLPPIYASELEYCSLLWHPKKIGDIKIIEGVQRAFMSKISALSHNYWERLRKLKLMSAMS